MQARMHLWKELFNIHRPRVLVVYGIQSYHSFGKAIGSEIGALPDFNSDQPAWLDSKNGECRVIVCRHPAFNCTNETLDTVGNLIKECC